MLYVWVYYYLILIRFLYLFYTILYLIWVQKQKEQYKFISQRKQQAIINSMNSRSTNFLKEFAKQNKYTSVYCSKPFHPNDITLGDM